MARLAHVIAPGMPHHVTQRGNRSSSGDTILNCLELRMVSPELVELRMVSPELVKELYNRVEIWMDYHRKTGERITALAKSYNDSVASLQWRFFPACRKFQELTALADEIPDVEPVSIGISLPPGTETTE